MPGFFFSLLRLAALRKRRNRCRPPKPPGQGGARCACDADAGSAGRDSGDDTILKDAKTQTFGGQNYAAIAFERLQAHVDAICHYDKGGRYHRQAGGDDRGLSAEYGPGRRWLTGGRSTS